MLRLFNTYGPGQKLSPYVGVVTIFVNRLAGSDRPIIFGDGFQARDFVHADDVASGFVCAMQSEVSGETFNIGTGRATTVNEVYRLVAAHMASAIQAEHAAPMPGELRFSVADISKARRLLGYEPAHEFPLGLGPVVDEILAGRPADSIAP